MPGVIGLAFLSPAAVKLILDDVPHRGRWAAQLYPNKSWDEWMAKKLVKRKRVALLTDKAKFQQVLEEPVDYVVAFCPWSWLQSRGITTIDGSANGPNVVVNKKLTPSLLLQSIEDSESYQLSETDQWLQRGRPKTRHKVDPDQAWEVYSLSNLMWAAVNHADESLFMASARDYWKATFQFAIGQLPRKDWLSRYGRSLKTAGTPRADLQNISKWVKAYGAYLANGRRVKPITTLDLKLAKSFGKLDWVVPKPKKKRRT